MEKNTVKYPEQAAAPQEDPMDQPVLTDKTVFPREKAIFAHLGNKKALWQSFFKTLHENHPDFSEEWRYYNDGKCWLMKVTKKSKTIFWLSVLRKAFRTTFYFSDKAEEAIMKSSLAGELKEQFKTGKKFNTIRGLRIAFRSQKDIEQAKILIALKLSVK